MDIMEIRATITAMLARITDTNALAEIREFVLRRIQRGAASGSQSDVDAPGAEAHGN
jgi:hypothetical protein